MFDTATGKEYILIQYGNTRPVVVATRNQALNLVYFEHNSASCDNRSIIRTIHSLISGHTSSSYDS